ncbi:Imm63 family immunity protein [Luteibacter sp. CQ10]|uniref:Imm63 family immunity protein n=1 Tax=Luteibacter sp. CQ10 TaxID=2805821 RepID=UPI0034A41370
MANQEWLRERGEKVIDPQTLQSLQQRMWDLGQRIGAPKDLLVVRKEASGVGDPYIDCDGKSFLYIVSERGTEFSRKVVSSEEELLHLLLSDAVSQMAWDYELDHRVDGRDPRRIAFQKMIELMDRLDPSWGAQMRAETEEILLNAPYKDDI